jgi:hypothetical protein
VRWTVAVGVAALGALAARRVAERAEAEGRPLVDLLSELPDRLAADLATVPDDLRMAVREGRLAAERRARELDEQLREATGASPGGPPPAAAD